MINVYFETKTGAHMVAQFDEEEVYMACLPALEKQAESKGYIVTESVDSNKTFQGEKQMNRQPHSKYEHGIVKWELRAIWSDGKIEVMGDSLPETLRNEIEQHIVDLEDLRDQDPEGYFMEVAK